MLLLFQVSPEYKPLLLWFQGGPGKSALYGQFLENGPLGIDVEGKLFRRRPSILSDFNVVYLDAPAGSGYSFSKVGRYPLTLEEAAEHTMRFMKGFLRIFPEYKDTYFFIAGESYGEGKKTLFEELTGFQSHGSIIRDQRPEKVKKYMAYANSAEFKRIIHVSPTRVLDGTRAKLAMTLAVGDFFIDKTQTLADVLNNVHVLFYTAQLDAVFPDNSADLIFTVPDIKSSNILAAKKNKSRVCLPEPCSNVEAYSGFIKVDKYSNSSLFFLHVKSQDDADKKPLLLWLQGGPGKSSLFGQFLENGPLGIDANGKLFYRNHTIANDMNIIYLDQPAGSGYSFNDGKNYASTLENASNHIIRFVRRFVRIFPEYIARDFYIAGESYGARFAVGLASEMLKNKSLVPLNLRGVMLGVGFLFPVVDLIDSSDYLFSSGLLDRDGQTSFAEQFQVINELVNKKNYTAAAVLLSRTVLNTAAEVPMFVLPSVVLSGRYPWSSGNP
ncbi:vitellogenic carboxypeptidase-like [Rhipicephalus sanguineus]|uniref:vitellogenic carboxypeptidase-like n=1 Tax=Rhipicephalus sanguineus TaxID=34632 RepID=UPI0020C5A179|nr:vitellogenic carboxypeptidase-like [Rhipicephalus sanguineus]